MTTKKLDIQAAETAEGNEAVSSSICICGGEYLQFIALSIHPPVLPSIQTFFTHSLSHSVCL